MSRRSHHPARRHVRIHAEPRGPRPAPATDAQAGISQEPTAGEPGLARPSTPARSNGGIPLQRTEARPRPAAPPPASEPSRQADPPPRVAAGAAASLTEASLAPRSAPGLSEASPAPNLVAAGWRGPGRPGPGPGDAERNGCTAPQLRRFIKSRAYVPMHELRRRFAIEGGDDDVTPVDMDPGVRVFVGLPNREGRLLGELLRSGDIGYELSFDPITPIVVGVFPMRPVPRA
jgi:hypothetical protein